MAKIAFTASRVAGFKCPADKEQAFLWDVTASGLGLRATPAGKPAYVFQGEFQGKSIRITIGGPNSWSIPQAQEKARELQRQIDEGHDPRDLKRGVIAAAIEKKASAAAQVLTVGDVWPQYLAEGKPKRKDAWKLSYRADLELLAKPGGEKKKRGAGLTRPGTLYPLMALTLTSVTEDSLQSWFDLEAKTSKHQAARALMMFRGFLRWCAARPAYRGQVDRDAGRGAALAEAMPQVKKRTDCLEDAQVAGWFSGVDKLGNRTIAIYLKGLLLTGARREELAALKWVDVDFRWSRVTLADKVDATRIIPLTPYLAQQLALLPRKDNNVYVFSCESESGHVIDPRASHARAMLDAGITTLTTHGLRRSFSLLGEASGAPAGAIAQVMGHKPSATAEGYRPRSVDALMPYLTKIEAYILERAGVTFVAEAMPGTLRVVA